LIICICQNNRFYRCGKECNKLSGNTKSWRKEMPYSEEEKVMWLEDWHQSGKSAWAYAKANGLNTQTFVKWTKSKTETQNCFVEVPTQILPAFYQSQEILIEKGDVKIHIPLTLGRNELRAVMEGLGAVL